MITIFDRAFIPRTTSPPSPIAGRANLNTFLIHGPLCRCTFGGMSSITIDIYYPRPYSGKDRAEYFATIDGVKRPSSFDELTSLLDNEDNERVVCPSTYYHRQFKFYTPKTK